MSSYNNHNDYNNHNNYNNYSNHNENYNAKYGVKSCKRNIKKIIMRAVALLMCGACLITCLSIFFENLTSGTTAYADDVTVTYTSGDANGSAVTNTATYDTRLYSLLLLDWDGFGYDNFATSSVSSGSDGANFGSWTYTNNQGTVDGTYTPAFAGWKLTEINGSTYSGTTTYIYPDNDYIYFNDEPFASYISSTGSITSLTFEAVWGRTVYLRDQYNFNDLGNVYGDDSGIAIAEIDWDTSDTYSSDSYDGATSTYPVASLSQAETLLNGSGGKIVIVNHYTFEADDGYYYNTWDSSTGATYSGSATDNASKSTTYYQDVGKTIESGIITISGLNEGSSTGEGKDDDDASYYTNAYLYMKQTRGNGWYLVGSSKTTYYHLAIRLRFYSDTVIEGLNILIYRDSWNLLGSRSYGDQYINVYDDTRLVLEDSVTTTKRTTNQDNYGYDTTNWLHVAQTNTIGGSDVTCAALSYDVNMLCVAYSHTANTAYNHYLTIRGDGGYASADRTYGTIYVSSFTNNYNVINNIHVNISNTCIANLYLENSAYVGTINFVGISLYNVVASNIATIYGSVNTDGNVYNVGEYAAVIGGNSNNYVISTFYVGLYNTNSAGNVGTVSFTKASFYMEQDATSTAGAKITNFYGGGNTVTCISKGTFNFNIDGGTITNFYGGGNGGYMGDSSDSCAINITMTGGEVSNMYGGGAGGLVSVYSNSGVISLLNSEVYCVEEDDNLWYEEGGTKYYYPSFAAYKDKSTATDYTAYYKLNPQNNNERPYTIYDREIAGSIYTIIRYVTVYYYGSGNTYYNYVSYYKTEYEYTVSDAAVHGDITIKISGGEVTNNVYGGGRNGSVTGNIDIEITGGSIGGSVYGGGYGNDTTFTNSSLTPSTFSAKIYFTADTTQAEITSNSDASTNYSIELFSTVASASSTSYYKFANWVNALGKSSALTETSYYLTLNEFYNKYGTDGYVYIYCDTINKMGTIIGDVTINISGGSIGGSVYGGSYGAVASIQGDTTIEISGSSTSIGGSVYGGGNAGAVSGSTSVTLSDGTISGTVYGGGNKASVGTTGGNTTTTVTVSITGGTVTSRVYGGGYAGAVNSNIILNISGGIINSDIYGGSYGADVNGTITVSVTGEVTGNVDGTTGKITNVFGGNNVSGDISGAITVNISISTTATISTTITNVYGGGNKAAYTGDSITLNYSGGISTNIFGGGLSANATITYVNISQDSGKTTTITSVYGGGSEGDVNTTNVSITEGTINSNVYGGGKNGDVTGNTSVAVSGGTMTGLYGGGYKGAVTGSTTVNISGGSIGTVYGGGYGDTATSGSTNVTITNGTIGSSVYGGGNNGAVTGSTTVNISGGSIGTVYGGGYGDTATSGSTNVTITNGTISGSVYGGGNEGEVTGSSTVAISGTSTSLGGSVFGGGNNAAVGSVSLTVSEGTFAGRTFYGGGNKGAVNGNIEVTVTGGTISVLYGGCKEAAVGGNITISVKDCTITTLFGGNNVSGDISGTIGVTVSQDSGTTNITTIYGGGNAANYTGTSATVAVSGGTVRTVYGGGLSADVSTASVTVSGGSVTASIYGGGYEGNITNSAAVTLSGGAVTQNIYGGGYEGNVTGTTAVTVSSGSVANIYGGGENGDVTGATSVAVSGGSVSGSIYGGGYNGDVTGSATVAVSGGAVSGSIYGGGENGDVTGATSVEVSGTGTTVGGSIYGGGYAGDVGEANAASSATVAVSGGTVSGSVYGGGYDGNIYGTTAVTISSDSSTTTIIKGSVYGACYGASACVTSGTEITIDLAYSFTAAEVEVTSTNTATSGEIATTITGTSGYNSVIEGSVYGGGNLGTVGAGTINTSTNTATISNAATTSVTVISGHILGSVYGGGYGVPASGNYNIYMGTVFGSTSVTISGDDNGDYVYIVGNVFGGGSQSRVYAASSASGVYAASVNISTASSSHIALGGSVFGGGERGNSATTNASVPTTIGNVQVIITGNGDSTAATMYFVSGGVYGDGNLCLVNGTRTITITNLTYDGSRISGLLKTFYSLQRADTVTLSNSRIVLLGAVDLVAEGDSTTYSINRITTLNLTNGSTIKLDRIVNYLDTLVSDVEQSRIFIDKGNNGTNDYTTDGGSSNNVNALTDAEVSAYIAAANAGSTVFSNQRYANTVCVANGLSLELRTTSGEYGTVTGLFTLSLLYANEGEGGGFVYASIENSTGDFICVTKYANSNDYMPIVDNVGGYKNNVYTYYYWYIQGSTINYTLEVTGYIGSSETAFDESGTIPQHTAARYYVLHGITLESTDTLAVAIVTDQKYELVQTDSGLTGQQIAIEIKIGDSSLGFLYYNSTESKWGIYQSATEIYYGSGGTTYGSNILASALVVGNTNDSIYFVLHKSTEVNTELSGMKLAITLDIYEENNTNNGIGDIVTGGTSQLIVKGTANIVRLVPEQATYKTTGKNYGAIDTNDNVTTVSITVGSSFTFEYQTKYIPGAYPYISGTSSMTWALTTAGYTYYMDDNGNYMTLCTIGGTTTCTSISSLLNYDGGPSGSTPSISTIYNDGNGYFYYTDLTGSGTKVNMNQQGTFTESTIPAGTKITMIDLTGGSTNAAYYYYICTADTTTIDLDSFIKMGSTTTIGSLTQSPIYKSSWSNGNSNTQVNEDLIFIFDFEDVTDTTYTGDFRVHLQHLYQASSTSNATDIMDFVSSKTENNVTTYTRTAPVLTEYAISDEPGYTLTATFGSNSYYDLDTAVLNVNITEDTTYINTRLTEYNYALKIELVNGSGTALSFPVGMLFEYEYDGKIYQIAASGTYVIIPIETSGDHTINIINELYSLKTITQTSSATFKVSLYSAPDASYYNYINWSSYSTNGCVTASYTINDNLTYALCVAATTTQVLTSGETLGFTVQTACSGTSSETVSVSLLQKDGSTYTAVDMSELFSDFGGSTTLTATTTATAYTWTISSSATTGTYRLVFTYGDHIEYLNVIVY